VHEFLNVKNKYGRAADANVRIHGNSGVANAHGHGCGGNALYALFAVRLDDLKRALHSGIVNADEEGGVAVQKKTAGRGDLRDLKALGGKTSVNEMSIVVINDRNNKFHKKFRPCKLQRFSFLCVFKSISKLPFSKDSLLFLL
jgi:hypothetical protein